MRVPSPYPQLWQDRSEGRGPPEGSGCSRGYGKGTRVSMETQGERRKRFWAGSTKGTGAGLGLAC